MQLEEALEMYEVQLQADGRSEHTINQYRRHLGLFANWLRGERRGAELESLDPPSLAGFLVSELALVAASGVPKKPSTLNALRSSLRTFFAYLHAAGVTPANPARLIRRARVGASPPRALKPEEEQALFRRLARAKTWAERRDRALFAFIALSGVRLSAALAIEIEDVDLAAGEVWLRTAKGGGERRLVVGAGAREALAGWLREIGSGPLFPTRDGLPMGSRQARRRLSQWLVLAGVTSSASPHWLRHGFAMRLYEKTGDLLLVQAALHHKTLAATVVYAQCSTERLRRALG